LMWGITSTASSSFGYRLVPTSSSKQTSDGHPESVCHLRNRARHRPGPLKMHWRPTHTNTKLGPASPPLQEGWFATFSPLSISTQVSSQARLVFTHSKRGGGCPSQGHFTSRNVRGEYECASYRAHPLQVTRGRQQ
jgi:hypothetical protein